MGARLSSLSLSPSVIPSLHIVLTQFVYGVRGSGRLCEIFRLPKQQVAVVFAVIKLLAPALLS